MSEIWKDVVGYEGLYEVSDLGRVRSVPRIDSRKIPRGGHLMKIQIAVQTGYPVVGLHKAGKLRLRTVHQMVLEAFVGPCPAGYEGCHRDDVRTNSVLANLRWGTRKSNHADRDRNGRTARGEKNGGANKLTDAKVREIRARNAKGESYYALAKQYGVSDVMVSKVCRRLNWTHV